MHVREPPVQPCGCTAQSAAGGDYTHIKYKIIKSEHGKLNIVHFTLALIHSRSLTRQQWLLRNTGALTQSVPSY